MNAISPPVRVQLKPLGEIVTFLDHMRRPVRESERKPGPYPYYGANGLQGTIEGYLFDEPLILMAEDGGHFDEPERGIAYRVSGKVWVNNHAHVLRPKPGTDWAYLSRALENLDVRQFVSGTTRGKLTKGQAEKILVPLPPLPEQRRIAAILDQADALRAKRREALAKLDEMAQAIFMEMFGDVSINSKGFNVVRMSSLLDCPPNFGSMIPPREDRQEWVSLRVANIQDWKLSFISKKYIDLLDKDIARHTVRDGDIILARAIASQEHLGKCVVVSPGHEKWAFDSHIMRIRVNRNAVSPFFLRDFFQSTGGREIFLKSTRKTTVQYNINTKEFSSLQIPLPPLEQQQQYEDAIGKISVSKSDAKIQERLLNDFFSSLQHRAFSGVL